VLLQTCFDEAYRRVIGGEIDLVDLENSAFAALDPQDAPAAELFKNPRLVELLILPPKFAELDRAERQRLLTLSTVTASEPTTVRPTTAELGVAFSKPTIDNA